RSRQSFTYPKATHGALSYPVTRVPMMFFGPGIDGQYFIFQADLIDFTPSLLFLLGINFVLFALDGRPLVNYYGQPLTISLWPGGIFFSSEVIVTRFLTRRTTMAAADLSIASSREVQPAEVSVDTFWAVMLAAQFFSRRVSKLTDEGATLYEFDS